MPRGCVLRKKQGDAPFRPDLIYDVGMHRGEDAEFYLKKGYDVVGFEANPDLVASAKNAFAEAIASGRLRIIEGAIVSDPNITHITFFRYDDRSKWGTISDEVVP